MIYWRRVAQHPLAHSYGSLTPIGVGRSLRTRPERFRASVGCGRARQHSTAQQRAEQSRFEPIRSDPKSRSERELARLTCSPRNRTGKASPATHSLLLLLLLLVLVLVLVCSTCAQRAARPSRAHCALPSPWPAGRLYSARAKNTTTVACAKVRLRRRGFCYVRA